MYYTIYQHFLSAINHLDHHLGIHAENDPKASHRATNIRYKRNVYNSYRAKQYADLIAYKAEYLSKLMVAVETINEKLHWEISNIPLDTSILAI